MQSKYVLYMVLLSFFVSSCALMYKEDPEFDESRVPGDYEGQITCSYEPCDVAGQTSFNISRGESNFTLHFEDSLSTRLPDLDFTVELERESYGEAVTVSGYISLDGEHAYKLTPYDQHFFYYWTYYDNQQEGERFEMKIYKPGPDNTAPYPEKYLELTGHRGIQ